MNKDNFHEFPNGLVTGTRNMEQSNRNKIKLEASLMPSELKYFLKRAKDKYGIDSVIVKQGSSETGYPEIEFSAGDRETLWNFVRAEYDSDFDSQIFHKIVEQNEQEEKSKKGKMIMETKEIIKLAQEENLVAFEKGVTTNVLERLRGKIDDYQKSIGDQVTAYFNFKEPK
jgi:hypothetical protein